MLLTYKDYTIVHNVTQLKGFATEPFRYSRWCLQSYTQPKWNGHSSHLSHWIMSPYTSGMSQSQYNSISIYGKKVCPCGFSSVVCGNDSRRFFPLCAVFEQYFPTTPVYPLAVDACGPTPLFGSSEHALCLILPF